MKQLITKIKKVIHIFKNNELVVVKSMEIEKPDNGQECLVFMPVQEYWTEATWYDFPYNCFYFPCGVTKVKAKIKFWIPRPKVK